MYKKAGLAIVLWLSAALALASDPELRIGELSVLDRQYMHQQRQSLRELGQRHLGRGFSGDRDRDLGLMQTLLDRGLVRNDQKQELQAMGVVLGDLLAAELDMHWVVYEDRIGRSRALRYRDTDIYLFPVTMISRRREADNDTPVSAIYDSARGTVERLRPDQPYR